MSVRPRDLPDHLLPLGRYEFTLDDAVAILGSDRGAAADALGRLQWRKQVFSPARGLYVAVPPEYRSWGALPGDWFIAAMMAHVDRAYYVALLSAARLHGASPREPQVFELMSAGAAWRDRDLGA